MTKTSIRLSRVAALATVGALFAGLSLPAQAASTETASNAASSARTDSADATEQRADSRASQRRICVRGLITGSRLPHTVCKTAREWEAAGGLPNDDR